MERDGPDGFRAVLSSKVAFITVRVDVVARYEEVDRPRHLRLVLDGSPRGLSGSFHVEIAVDISPIEDGGSDVSYTDRRHGARARCARSPARRSTRACAASSPQALLDLDGRTPHGDAGAGAPDGPTA